MQWGGEDISFKVKSKELYSSTLGQLHTCNHRAEGAKAFGKQGRETHAE